MALDLPDDALALVIGACSTTQDIPHFEDVKGLGCISKGVLQQLHRLRPLVGVRSLAVLQRAAHDPWRVVLLYQGELTAAVIKQRRVRSIDARGQTTLARAVARRVVPGLLGAGGSLLELNLEGVQLAGTWAATFGEAAVCSAVLRKLSLHNCGLRGPLPELRLPRLVKLDLSYNNLTGGLRSLQACTALQELSLQANQLTGSLEPLRACTALQILFLSVNQLTGSLEPLRGCTALQLLYLSVNQLTGGLEPLGGCTALQELKLYINQLTGGLEPLRSCAALQILFLGDNPSLTGDLEPIRGCAALQTIHLVNTQHDDRARFVIY